MGNIHTDIIDHENRIIQRLTGFVLQNNKCIRQPLRLIALIDWYALYCRFFIIYVYAIFSLIAMARVAEQHNYVRPYLTNNAIHDIQDGRHPLLDTLCNHFEPNSFYSGGCHNRVKLLTGPNGSGKSVYLKQVALMVYLAHVGSFVPARKATIGLVHSIHSRMHASESVAVRLSSFMIDLSQVKMFAMY